MNTSRFTPFLGVLSFLILMSCNNAPSGNLAIIGADTSPAVEKTPYISRDLSDEFKEYWYAGEAEITSYRLVQERYGELREGTAVNIFVTEDFLPEVQVKADRYAEKNIPVLKLNTTKKFLTGIYPYSLMTSSFSPVNSSGHALKVTHSMQEWCGQVYIQLNNKNSFELMSHSYFEGEADQKITLPKTWLENEIWNILRIAPEELPIGEFSMIPAFEYTRMGHVDVRAHTATGELTRTDGISSYTINYPSLDRQITLNFQSEFPYQIEGWEETHANGLKTTAEKISILQSAYWLKNRNKDTVLRDSLGL